MKAILEFDLPEEEYEFNRAVQSKNLSGAMLDIEHQLRSWYKYGHEFKDADEAVKLVWIKNKRKSNGYKPESDPFA